MLTESTYTLPDLISMFIRGDHFTLLIVMISHFAVTKRERYIYHYCFAMACVALELSLILSTVIRILGLYHNPEIENICTLLDLSIIPLLATIFPSMLRQPKSWKPIYRFLLISEIPFLLGAISYLLTASDVITSIMKGYSLFYVIGVVVFGYVDYIRYNRLLLNAYASLEGLTITWCRNVIITLPMLFISYYFISFHFSRYYTGLGQPLYILLSEICLIIIAANLNNQKPVDMSMLVATDTPVEENESVTMEDTGVDVEDMEERLKEEFLETEVFTNPNINIRSVSHLVGIKIPILSNFINKKYGMNFNQYVNKQRVDMACRLIDDEGLSANEIAEKTGFSSQAAFYRVFKIITGYTPTEYRTTVKQQNISSNSTPENSVPSSQLQPIKHSAFLNLDENIRLSIRERELCDLIVSDLSNDEICQRMNINQASLRVARSRVRQKLGLTRKDSLENYLQSTQQRD